VSRYIDVTAGVTAGADPAAVADTVQRRLQGMSLPLEYRGELLGPYSARQSVSNRLLPLAAAVTIGMFLLFQAAFGSWRLASLLFANLVVALAGGVVAAWAGTGGISLGSLFGFLAVVGMTARGSLLLLERYRHLESNQGGLARHDLILRGAGERLAPVATSSVATVLALIPFLVAGQAAGVEIVQPMAVVIVGGLVTALLLNLFVLPIAYLRFGSRSDAGNGRN
jgi:Cu/Ag efflux pump CusA